MKRGLSILLVLCLLAVLLPAAPAQAEEAPVVCALSVGEILRPAPGGEQQTSVEVTADVEDAIDSTEVFWYDLGTNPFEDYGTLMAKGETFTLNHRARAVICVYLKPDFSFRQEKVGKKYVYLGTVEMEGRQNQTVEIKKESGREYLELNTLPFRINNDVLVTDLTVEGLSLGVEGDQPDHDVTVSALPEESLNHIDVQWWRSGVVVNDAPLTDGYYSVRLYLYFNDGYYPCDPEFRYRGNLNVEGWNVEWATGQDTSNQTTCLWVQLQPRLSGLYTINLEPGAGSGSAEPIVFSGDADVLAPECPFTPPEDWRFDHWEYPLASGGKGTVVPGEAISKNRLTGSAITLTAVYVELPKITELTVNGISRPIPGAQPDLTAEVTLNEPNAVQAVSVTWYREDREAPMQESEVFQADQNYYCVIRVALQSGYVVVYAPSETDDGLFFTGTVNWADYCEGYGCSVWENSAGVKNLTLQSPVFCLNADISGLDTPYHGEPLDFDVSLAQDDVSLTQIAWYDVSAGSWMQEGQTAKAGNTYRWQIALFPEPETGEGRFSADGGRFLGTVTCNGEVLDDASVRILQQEEEFNGAALEPGTMVLSGEITAFAFADVRGSDWFADAVYWAFRAGVTKGSTATLFAPVENCTRAQIVTFLWRAYGCPEPETDENPFVDVRMNQYYAKAVLWAVGKGITMGADRTHFQPNATCTRAQAVTFLWRSAGCPEPEDSTNPFTDVRQNQYYTQAVLWAVEKGITKGVSNTRFAPQDVCIRAEIVTFMYRFFHTV